VVVRLSGDVYWFGVLLLAGIALFLISVMLAVRPSRQVLLFLHLVALAVALIALAFQTHDWFILSVTGVSAFVTTALLAHRTLYEARPAAQYLTEFYLWLSFGGALGGMFAALLAPHIFREVYEYPVLLALSMACWPGALALSAAPQDRERTKDELIVLWLLAAVGLLVIWWVPEIVRNILAAGSDVDSSWLMRRLARSLFQLGGPTPVTVMVLAAILLANVRFAPRQLLGAALMCLALVTLPSAVRQADSQITKRSFFGVYRVADSPETGYRTLVHGTTLHGAQKVYDDDGNEVYDTQPTTYYYPASPIGQTIAKRRAILAAKGEKGRYGIVGLGTGSSSCHKQEGESWKFFEIDPTVIGISKDPKNFQFISKCQPNIDIAIGDARLTMGKEPDSSFDLFIIDAFTSDAIPVHMLTKEAVELFLRKLKPDGVVLLHTSNRYLDLNSVLGAILKMLPPGTAGVAMHDSGERDESYGTSGSSAVVFAKSEAALEPYRSLPGYVSRSTPAECDSPRCITDLDDNGLRAWTDDYSDILGAFVSRYRGRG
jgi:hypothetical protein